MIILATGLFCPFSISDSPAAQNEHHRSGSDEISIYQITPDRRDGKAYKLVYLIKVQMDVYWRFKTDFENNFLVTNKYVQEHRFIARNGNKVITENKYLPILSALSLNGPLPP